MYSVGTVGTIIPMPCKFEQVGIYVYLWLQLQRQERRENGVTTGGKSMHEVRLRTESDNVGAWRWRS